MAEMIEIVRTREVGGKIIMEKEDFEKLLFEIEALIETLEILSDKELMRQIEDSVTDINEGRVEETSSIEELRRKLFE
ncbi:MAG: hypothetical protein H0Z19_10175 [Archaeoglobus sp.]|uniref:hypothetical protein n=1 Tax=Archaeoglobus sp. TaxID=1872626 RepID=UPI001D3C1D37|nr:hypothetical protein [Archaeoglobus sp.]MBO8180821.1 hypothetical protein [Archaeoglobus sp.]